MLITAIVLLVVVGSLYALYRSVLAREDSYYDGGYGDFDGPDPDDYLTDSEWESIDPTYLDEKNNAG